MTHVIPSALTSVSRADYRLETHYIYAENEADDIFEFSLCNLGSESIENFTLTLSSIIRLKLSADIQNASLIDRVANLHSFSPPAGMKLKVGSQWRFSAKGLLPCRPNHRVDGPSSGYITDHKGNIHPLIVGDLHRTGIADSKERRLIPDGKTETALAIQPWPNSVVIDDYLPQSLPYIAAKADVTELRAMAVISALTNQTIPCLRAAFYHQHGD